MQLKSMVAPCLCFLSETITKEDWEQHVKNHTDKLKALEEKYKKKLTDAGVRG